MSVASQEAMTGEGVGRVRLRFLPDGPEVKVPPGVSLFDAASWNGVAIDSTCGGYGTCKKCKVRIVEGELPVSSVDPRAFTPDELRDGWRLACRAQASCDLVIDVPPLQTRPEGRDRRRRPPGDPAPERAEALPRALRAEPAGPGLRSRAHPPGDGRPRAARRRRRRAHAAAARARERLEGHRRRRRRRADRRRGRRHDRAHVRHRVRPRHDDRRRDAARPLDRHARRGALDPQPPAALRRRRHPPHLGDDDGPDRRCRSCRISRRARSPISSSEVLRAGRGRARRGLRGRARRQRDDDAARCSASTPSRSAWRRSSWPRRATR